MSDNAANDEVTGDPELDAAAAAHWQEITSDENNLQEGGDVAGSDPSGSVGSDPQHSTPETPIDQWEWDDGYKLTKAQARSYAELEAYLYANPDKQQALAQFLSGQTPSIDTTPSGVGSKIQEDTSAQGSPTQISLEDITDPEVRFVYERYLAQEQELAQLRQLTSGATDYISTQQQQTAESLFTRGITSFKEDKSLSDDEVNTIAEVAGRLNVLPSLMAPTDPITGAPRRVDPLAAIEEALTIAYWQIPEFRDRAISSQVEDTTRNKARKQKLSSLQGSSGSVPREQPVANTEHGRREQMIREVAGFMGREN